MPENPVPKGVAVYDRPTPSSIPPAALITLVLGAIAATAAGLHYFHYF